MKYLKLIAIFLASLSIFNLVQSMEDEETSQVNAMDISNAIDLDHMNQLDLDLQAFLRSYQNTREHFKANLKRKANSEELKSIPEKKKLKKDFYSFPFDQLPDNCIIQILTDLIDAYLETKDLLKVYINFDDFMSNIILALPKHCKAIIDNNHLYLKDYFRDGLNKKHCLLDKKTKTRLLKRLNTIRSIIRSMPQATHLLLLPDEILLRIFNYLIPSFPTLNDQKPLKIFKTSRIDLNNLGLSSKKLQNLIPELTNELEQRFSKCLTKFFKIVIIRYLQTQKNSIPNKPTPKKMISILNAFLKAGADPEFLIKGEKDAKSLISPLFSIHPTLFSVLTSKIKDLNANDSEGDTLLNRCIRDGSYDLALELIIKYQVNLNLKNSNGNTPLIIAIKRYHNNKTKLYQITKTLLERGAYINIQNKDGKTALMELTNYYQSCNIELLELLQKYNADPNLQDIDGDTALIMLSSDQDKSGGNARLAHYKSMAKLLIKMGARLDIVNKQGKSIHSFVSRGERAVLSEIIQELS